MTSEDPPFANAQSAAERMRAYRRRRDLRCIEIEIGRADCYGPGPAGRR
jgi:hypothetical protein